MWRMDMKGNGKIQVLEFLRFLSLTEVFLVHYMNDYIHSEEGLKIVMVSGKLGVAFFFMITSYLLVLTTEPWTKGFLKRKAIQLLPKYELILVAVFVGSKFAPGLFRTLDTSNSSFIKSMLLIPYKTPGVPFSCPMLPVAWTLGVQAVLFIVFWVLMSIFKSTNIAAVASIVLIVILVNIGSFVGYENIISFTYCRFYMLYFVTGFITALFEKSIWKNKNIKIKSGGGQYFFLYGVVVCY